MGGMPIDSGFITFLILIIGAIAAAWWRIEGVVKSSKKDLQDETGKAVTNAMTQANSSANLAALVSSQLNEFKLYVAENYVRRDGIKDLRDQLMQALGEVKIQVEGVRNRMDRMVELEAARALEDKVK